VFDFIHKDAYILQASVQELKGNSTPQNNILKKDSS